MLPSHSGGRNTIYPIGDQTIQSCAPKQVRAIQVVDGIAADAKACGVCLVNDLGRQFAMVGVERNTIQCAQAIEPIGRELVEQQRARQLRHRLARGSQRIFGKRRQQRRHGGAGPQCAGIQRNRRAGAPLRAWHRLDLDIGKEVVGAKVARDGCQRGHRLAGVGGAVPTACIQLRDLTERERIKTCLLYTSDAADE